MGEGNDVLDEIKQFQQVISAYFSEESRHAIELARDDSIIAFLSKCNADTCTIEEVKYQDILKVLRKTKGNSNEIFLTFIGIQGNKDQIDNFGISRHEDYKKGSGDKYEVTKRAWYNETVNSITPEEPTITLPYMDASGSYVISITKGIWDKKGNCLGVVGLDVLVRNIVRRLNTEKHIIILTESGEIVYNSETYMKDILEKRHNVLLLLEPYVLDKVKSNEIGAIPYKMPSKKCTLGYGCLVKDKYYLIIIDSKKDTKVNEAILKKFRLPKNNWVSSAYTRVRTLFNKNAKELQENSFIK